MLWGAAILFGFPCILWLSLSIWFPWILKPWAARHGLHYSSYERQGFRRFTLREVAFTNDYISFRAAQAESWLPTVWVWRAFVRKESRPQAYLLLQDWHLDARPRQTNSRAGNSSVSRTASEVSSILETVARWMPAATGSNGLLQLPGVALEIKSMAWSPSGLSGQLKWLNGNQDLVFNASLGKGKVHKVQLRSESLKLQSTITLALNATGLNIQSRNLWWSNRVDLQAQFARSGLFPEKAGLQAPGFRVQGSQAGVPAYPDINGSLFAKWERDHFELTVNAAGQPREGETNLPPLSLDLRARGDTNKATIKSATIASAFLTGDLSQELNIYYSKPFVRDTGHFKVLADLSKQSWFTARGIIDGQAQFTATTNGWPDARFELAGFDIGKGDLMAEALSISGLLHWPNLEVIRGAAVFEDGSFVETKGTLDLQKREVTVASVESGGPIANRWLPPNYAYQQSAFSGTVRGPFSALSHQGRLEISNFTSPYLQPLQLKINWSGTNRVVDDATLSLTATNSSVQASGSLVLNPEEMVLNLKTLKLEDSNQPLSELKQPVKISFRPGPTAWHFETTQIQLSGKAGEIHAQAAIGWPVKGAFQFAVTNVRSESVRDFLPARSSTFELKSWQAQGGWTNGALGLFTEMHGNVEFGTEAVSADLQLSAGPAGISISNLNFSRQTSTVASAEGRLPLSIHPGAGTNWLQIDENASLDFKLNTDPNSALWGRLSDLTGLLLSEPRFKVALKGTWAAPEGDLELSAEAIKLRMAREELPRMEKLRLSIHFDRGLARISEGQVRVQDQPITLSGELPLGGKFWRGLRNGRLPDMEQASAHLQVQRAQISAFAPLIPAVLSPQGEFSLDLKVNPGGTLEGELTVDKARTRPLGNLGPIRDILVKMRIKDRSVTLENAAANVGGSIITASGMADLRGTNWYSGWVPPFRVQIKGTNVPLERQPESIVRSDLDLSVTKTNQNPAVISGTAQLRDSFYLRDVRDLAPGGVSSPGRRPPYFSVDLMPLANWRLAVHVTGSRFLKVRSTVFNGEISANVRLEGTLKEPLAIGDMRIDTGAIRFPFASLNVRQGFVTLASADPFHPQLHISAASKKFGYELKMEATGPADVPILQFTSTPPLSSEQIVLMVTAGELPKGSFTLTPQQKAQTVAVFVGRDLLAKFGLGDDSEDRLTFQSGEQISEQGRPTYGMEYKLNNRWSLVGEYDRFNAFNAGVKWRVYSK